MIRRFIEICPKCGQYDPWRTYKSLVVRGQKRAYVACKTCGTTDVIVYFDPHKEQKEPVSSEKGSICG